LGGQCPREYIAPFPLKELLGQEEFHYLDSGLGDAGAGAEDGGGACLVEEIVVLGGDYTAYYYHDILAAQFLELLDNLRNQGLMAGGK
jgi:hypothetical protein